MIHLVIKAEISRLKRRYLNSNSHKARQQQFKLIIEMLRLTGRTSYLYITYY